MEKKIDSIIDALCKHEISKQEAKDRLLVLFGVVGRSEQLKTFVDWWHGLSQEELAWYEGRYVEVFLSL